ncbi:MAG TPA: hypothetical protein VFI08_11865 [Spirochaetia bacterium]|nr:hypothetical protein [Spirochaetia bacterium]
MAIDSISPVMSASPLTTLSRPQETTPDAREAAAQENDARQVAQSVSGASPAALGRPEESSGPVSTGTRVPVAASPDTETTLQQSSAEIARASSAPDTGAAQRAASEAYQVQASAQQDSARQQQGNGATSIDVMA